MEKVNRNHIAEILRDNITVDGLGNYVIHGAIDKIAELINQARRDALDEAAEKAQYEFDDFSLESLRALQMNYNVRVDKQSILKLKDECL